ncbi:MAG: large conductance mechanosensitive channel protein MscL [Planctomycetaceae bacterium]|nr:large conductance mechanosensitive channel protein MscL [Planctomycetaceae bacterium]
MGLLKEFKEFALRGNVIDLAVGVIIGGAFGKITSSLVSDVIMPPIGQVLGKLDFKSMYEPLFDESEMIAAGKWNPGMSLDEVHKAGLPVFAYGSFLTTVLDFVILAFCVFLMVKLMNMAFKRLEFLQGEKAAAAPPEPPADVKLLTEIRDLLKAK